MSAQLGRVIIYTKKMKEVADFYHQHFGFDVLRLDGDRIVDLSLKELVAIYFCTRCQQAEKMAKRLLSWSSTLRTLTPSVEVPKSGA